MTGENILYALAGMAIGLLVGLCISVRWGRRDDGKPVIKLGLMSWWQRLFFIGIGVLAVFSVVGTAMNNESDQARTDQVAAVTRAQQQLVARQTYCNRELIRVINTNASIAASDRENFDEWMSTLSGLVLNPNPDRAASTARLQEAFRKYEDTKAANAANRQPYPPPDCGE